MKKRPTYADVGDLQEDERIEIVGQTAMHGRVVAFIVDEDGTGRTADRYIAKILHRFPGLVVLDRVVGPVPNTTAVRIGLPQSEN